MADKLSYTGTIFDTSRQDTVTPEKNQSARQCHHEDVRALLRNTSVPMEFKQSVQDVLPDPGSLSFTSSDAFAASDDPCSRIALSEMKICQDPAGLFAATEYIPQPFYFKDYQVNLSQENHQTAGLVRLNNRSLHEIICYGAFLQSSWEGPVYIGEKIYCYPWQESSRPEPVCTPEFTAARMKLYKNNWYYNNRIIRKKTRCENR